ncbi:MAG: YhjD/YihY/BrkB family envelope integrity protein, partial [Phycisphaeraceae bacterium]
MQWFKRIADSVARWWQHPIEELTRTQAWLRYLVDILRHTWRQLMEDRAEEMAAALSYRTIFSLIPLAVLGLILVRVFGGFDVQQIEQQLFRFFGVPEAAYTEQVSVEQVIQEIMPRYEQALIDQAGLGLSDAARQTEQQFRPILARGRAWEQRERARDAEQALQNPEEAAQQRIAELLSEQAGLSDDRARSEAALLVIQAQARAAETEADQPLPSESTVQEVATLLGQQDLEEQTAQQLTDQVVEVLGQFLRQQEQAQEALVERFLEQAWLKPALAEGLAEHLPEREAAERANRLVEGTQVRQLQVSLQNVLAELIQRIAELDFTGLGAAGVIVFIYAAMTLIMAIEWDFNVIFNAPAGRSITIRIAIYWSMITLGIGLLALSLYLSGQFVEWAREFSPLLGSLGRITAILASWMMLFLLYLLMPNTHVRLSAAAVGALVASLLWEAGKAGFQAYVGYTLPYSALYGSVGLIPLFLFWVYVSWMIVLFGLELAYTLQVLPGHGLEEVEKRSETEMLTDPNWVIPLMVLIGRAFDRGEPVEISELASQTNLPIRTAGMFCEHLRDEHLLHQVQRGEGEERCYSLAVPPRRIELRRLLEVAHLLGQRRRPGTQPVPGRKWVDRIEAAQEQA